MKLTPADKSLLITFTGASLLVLVFFFLGVKPYTQTHPEEDFIEIPVVQELEEPEPEIAKKEPQSQRRFKSHQAYNSRELQQETKQLFQEEDAVRKAIEERRLESVEDLMSETEKALAERRKSQEIALAERKELIKQQIEERERLRNSKKGNRESTFSYDLEGRKAIVIPNPVYTCDARGAIVLDITVSSTGVITKMEYNKKTSTSSNGCLIDQALDYAEQALFNASSKVTQTGAITFYFQG